MNGIIFVGGILSSKLQDDLLTAGMRRQKLGHVIDLSVQYNPAALCCVVLGHYREQSHVSRAPSVNMDMMRVQLGIVHTFSRVKDLGHAGLCD